MNLPEGTPKFDDLVDVAVADQMLVASDDVLDAAEQLPDQVRLRLLVCDAFNSLHLPIAIEPANDKE